MDKATLRRIGANRAAYERLKSDSSYTDVRFSEATGGLMAIHREHCFDPTIGKFGIPRGDYERIAAETLYEYGHSVILESEKNSALGVKTPEGLLDGVWFDIKGIEGIGKRNIIDKISSASRQKVEALVLYYHDINTFDEQHLIKAYHGYLKLSKNRAVQTVYCIVKRKLHKIMA